MRLTFSNVAILALFGVGSEAFAPSRTSTSSSVRQWQLGASNELSGMLSEYSSSAYSSAPAAAPVVSKAADVVPAAVTAPVADVAATSASATVPDSMAKLTEAVSAASEAASQAAAAATAVTAKATTASKVSSAAVAGSAAVKKIGGFEVKPLSEIIVQVDPSKGNADLQFDASARARENLAILKANLFGGVAEQGSGASLDFDLPSLPSFKGAEALSSTASLPAIIDALHLQEYGGWYVAAAMAITASQQRSAGKEEATMEFEEELAQAREKANEAASAAQLAAEGARMAKDLAIKMEKRSGSGQGNAILEKSRLQLIQIEKDIMQSKMRDLNKELFILKHQLEKVERKSKPVEPKAIINEEVTKMLVDRDPADMERVLELVKEIDEERRLEKLKAEQELEKKREAEAKMLAEVKRKEEEERMKAEAALAKQVAEEEKAEKKKAAAEKRKKKKAAEAKKKAEEEENAQMTKEVEAAQAEAEVAKKKTKGTATNKTAGTKKTSTAKSATKKKTAKKVADEPATPAAPSASNNEWAALADSTLKRKTIAQLTEYLSERGVSVTDGSGNALKKADLLEAVKSL